MTRNTDSGSNRFVDGISRRGVLKGLSAAALAGGGFSNVTAARQEEEPTQVFRLYGVADYWTGREPESIAGEKNPTLDLEAGKKYRIIWKNGDGASHNIAIYSQKGNLLVPRRLWTPRARLRRWTS